MSDELTDGVWWLSGTRGCNVYLVRADDGSFVLIDAAFASSAEAIVREMRPIVGDASITHVLLTHGHFDHVGSASRVAIAVGARIAAGAADCERVDGSWVLRRQEPRRLPAVRDLLNRVRGVGDQSATEIDDPLTGSVEVVPGIDAVPVPGHTAGGYCY
ncbi:MAG TPA: MBL fold metallo-hydrolase, partial [Dehalococcoidia bacterium]|nr:MBL fold metallo-hydrolase [Dehalococcoidia bacterium]